MATSVAPEVIEPVDLPVEDTGAVEPVAEPVAATAEPVAEPETASLTEGQQRDPATGKFLPKPVKAEEAGEQPPAEGETPEAVITEPAAPAAPSDPFAGEPWSMKVDGQNVVLDGAVILPGKGVLFPEQHMGIVRQMIARGIQYEQERPRAKQQIQQQQEQINVTKAELSVIGEIAQRIFTAKDEDELAALTFDIWSNKDKLQWEATKRREQAEIAAQKSALAPTPEQQQLEVDTRLGESLSDGFAQAKRAPWAANLQEKDWQALQRLIEPVRRSFIVRVPEDVPEAGLKQGDLAFNEALFFQFMEQQAGLLTTERATIAGEKKKAAVNAQAAARNTAALRSSVQAPPGVASAEKPAPTPGSGSVFTSREDYERWVRTGR